MPRTYSERKREYFEKLIKLVQTYDKVLVVGADNVGSNQMQRIRRALRGKAIVLMGKNTMMRTALRQHIAQDPEDESRKQLESLIPLMRENCGLVFITNSTLRDVKGLILANKVEAQAKAGAVSPCDVWIRAGPTGMEPTQTAFLQALNIATKIQKGQIEIITDFHLVKEGQRVSASEATLLQKLNMKPFHYGLTVTSVYESGFVYSPKALDVPDEDILEKAATAIQYVAALSLQTGFPTAASAPHSIINAFKNLVGISLETSFVFKQAATLKERFENPDAFAAAAPVAAAAAPAAAAPAAAAPAAKEESSEEDDFGGGGLFGDDDF